MVRILYIIYMVNDPYEIILDHLRDFRGRFDSLESEIKDLKQTTMRVRKDVHELRGDVLRIDETIATVSDRLEFIEKRLSLTDA